MIEASKQLLIFSLIEPDWVKRLKKYGLYFLNVSLLKQYINLCEGIEKNHVAFNELSKFHLSNSNIATLDSKKETKEIQNFIHTYTEAYHAYNSVKWHQIQAEILVKPTFLEKLRKTTSNKYVIEQLEDLVKHTEFAHFTAKALLLGDTIRACIDYLQSALEELTKKKEQRFLIWKKQIAEQDYCTVKKLLEDELQERKRQLCVLHYAKLARLKSASRHYNPSYEGILSDIVSLLVESYCLNENQKVQAIAYQRDLMDQKTFLALHDELFTYGSENIKQKLQKLYWMQPQGDTAVVTIENHYSVFPVPKTLAPYLTIRRKIYSRHWWNEGCYFRYQLNRKLIFPIAKINGAIERLKAETISGIANRGEFCAIDIETIMTHPTWQLLLETEKDILKNQHYYSQKLKKFQKKWFKNKTKACLLEVIALFKESKKPLNQCYLQFAQSIVEILLRKLHKQKKRSNLLSHQVSNDLFQLFTVIENKLAETTLFAEYIETKSSLKALVELDENNFFEKLKHGKPISELEGNYWAPATNEVTDEDEQYRLKLAEATLEGIYQTLCLPINLNQAGTERIKVLHNLMEFLYKITSIARKNAKDGDITFLQKKLLEYVSWAEDKIIDDYTRYINVVSQLNRTEFEKINTYCQIYEYYYQQYLKDNEVIPSEFVISKKDHIDIYQTIKLHTQTPSISRCFRESKRDVQALQREIKKILFEYFLYQNADYQELKKQLRINLEYLSKDKRFNIIASIFSCMLLAKRKIKNLENQLYYGGSELTGEIVYHHLRNIMVELEKQFHTLTNHEEAAPFKASLTKRFSGRFFTHPREMVDQPQFLLTLGQ